MRQEVIGTHIADADGNPVTGETKALGIHIQWQAGPLGRNGNRKEPNGAFVEGVIEAALDRLLFYQASKFACTENAVAIANLRAALAVLDLRTKYREARGVEGTHSA